MLQDSSQQCLPTMSTRLLKGFVLGPWTVKPLRGTVSGPNDEVRHLEPKVMDVFLCLAEGANELVTRQALLDIAWSGNNAFEKQLTRAIGEIRQALDDDPGDPKYIETIPKRGYRLMTPVQALKGTDSLLSHASSVVMRLLGRHRLGVAIVILLGLALAYVLFDKSMVKPGQSTGPMTTSVPRIGANTTNDSVMSIAVLPFVNLIDDPENEYFSDGLSEEILNLIARIPGLKVVGRASSFSFKGTDANLRDIGQALGVEMILKGSVRNSGDRVRIAAQLVNVADGAYVWSETYERTMSDIFAVQDDVAAAIADALQIVVGPVPVRGRPTESMQAYALFLRAKAAFNKFELRDTEAYLQQALEIDPNFAEAYELLAFNYWALTGSWLQAAEGQKLVGEAAANALAIDPDLVLANALYQATETENGAFLREVEAFEKVLRRQPNNPQALNALALYLLGFGYFREALGLAERYVDLDPLSLAANWRLGDALYAMGRTSEAVSVWEVIDQLDPRGEDWMFAVLNLIEGQDELAIAGFEAYLQRHDFQQSDFPDASWVRELVSGGRDPATGQAYLDRRVPQILASVPDEYAYGWQLMLTEFYLYLGFLDRYFELILESDHAAAGWTNAAALAWVGTKFRRLGFTAHPKYLEVAEKLGVTQVWEQRGPPDYCDKTGEGWLCE